MGKFPRKVMRYECPSCGELYEDQDEAGECCMEDIKECWQCVDCDDVHEEKDDAYHCCE